MIGPVPAIIWELDDQEITPDTPEKEMALLHYVDLKKGRRLATITHDDREFKVIGTKKRAYYTEVVTKRTNNDDETDYLKKLKGRIMPHDSDATPPKLSTILSIAGIILLIAIGAIFFIMQAGPEPISPIPLTQTESYVLGYKSGSHETSPEANPYSYEPDRVRWHKGWLEAKEDQRKASESMAESMTEREPEPEPEIQK